MKKMIVLLCILCSSLSIAQIVSIPDPNFKSALLENNIVIDTNGDGEIQVTEAEATTFINVSGWFQENNEISSLVGLEAFVNLTSFSASYNLLTEVDFTANTQLESLSLNDNLIAELDLSMLPNLTNLSLIRNDIASLDVSNNLALIRVNALGNSLTALDVSQNINLEDINVTVNDISTIDLSNNPLLVEFHCIGNNFETLDFSMNPNFSFGTFDGNDQLTYINFKNGTNEFIILPECSFTDLPNLESVCLDDENSELAEMIANQNSQTIIFTSSCILGSNDFSVMDDIVLFPIPSEDRLHIEGSGQYAVRVYGLSGRLLLEKPSNKVSYISISSLPAGIHIMEIKNERGDTTVRKIIKI